MTGRCIPVGDPQDPRLDLYRAVRERDLVGREGLFLAEGVVVLRVLLSGRSRMKPRSLLLSDAAAAHLGSLLDAVPPGTPIYVAPNPILEAVAGFPIHRGVLAIGIRAETELAGLLPDPTAPALVVGLVGLANHDNVGGIFRNAAAFGADAVLLDAGSCDPLYRKAIRVSVGGCLVVPFRRAGNPDDVMRLLTAAGFEIVALSPSGRDSLDAVQWPRRVALLVGPEGEGLPAQVLAAVRSVRIPMAPGFDSLNVATASGLALHAASRALGRI